MTVWTLLRTYEALLGSLFHCKSCSDALLNFVLAFCITFSVLKLISCKLLNYALTFCVMFSIFELCFDLFDNVLSFCIIFCKLLNYFLAFCITFSIFELCFDILHHVLSYCITFSTFELCSAVGLVPSSGKTTRNPGTRKQQPFNMVAQSISSELSKCVRDLILLVEQGSFCEDDVAQFRLDWLYSAVVRYVDHIPSGEAVMNRLHQVAVLLATNRDDCRNSSVPIQAEVMLTGQRRRPRYSISKDKLEFLLDMKFTSVEVASMLCVSESTVKRRIREYESYVRQRYSDFSDNDLDQIVERLMRESLTVGTRG